MTTTQEAGKLGGKKRWANLKKNKSKKEISEIMQKVSKSRLTKNKDVV